MQVPLEITYKDIPKEDWIEDAVHERVDKLQRLAQDMISCRVAVEMDHKRRQGSNPYHVRVETSLPGKKRLATASEPLEGGENSTVEVLEAIRDAFGAMEKRLKKAKDKK